ncbi:hypothetical protein [Natronomonas marina]|jgi:hypothetical protein|nr:hypothetical protein [Natronomonas marina]
MDGRTPLEALLEVRRAGIETATDRARTASRLPDRIAEAASVEVETS